MDQESWPEDDHSILAVPPWPPEAEPASNLSPPQKLCPFLSYCLLLHALYYAELSEP